MAESKLKYMHLFSNLTKISSKDGRTIDILGQSMMIAASAERTSYIGKDKKEVQTGCISGGTVSMISDAFYQNIETSELEHNLDFVGLYDSSQIYEKIKSIVQKQVTDSFIRKTPGIVPTPEQIDSKVQQIFENWFTIKATSGVAMFVLVQNFVANHNKFESNDLTRLKKEYQSCLADQFFYIPLTLVPFVPLAVKKSNHANGIFIRKSKGTVFRVEPQYYINETEDMYKERQTAINNGIIRLTNEIGLKNPTFVDIKVPCPQAIVSDKNCMFWSTYIFEAILKNIYKKDINTIILEISSKPKNELSKIMYEYKRDLFNIWIPKLLEKNEISWPEFETKKQLYLDELHTEFYGIPPVKPPSASAQPVLVGGKTRKQKKTRKNRKSKNRLARR